MANDREKWYMFEPKNIVDGYFNLAKTKMGIALNEEDQKLFDQRQLICDRCPRRSETNRCLECGCVLEAKTKAPNAECPLNKW